MYDINLCHLVRSLNKLKSFFQDLFHDPDYVPPRCPPIQLPFDEEHIQQGLNALPVTKALAPDGLPTVVWKTLASELAPGIFRIIQVNWAKADGLPPSHWSAG